MIVSNASPLIVLLRVNKLSILKELFEKVVVPEAVYEEITTKEHERLVFGRLEWIEARSVENIEMVVFLEKLIDRGEAEATVLAKELDATLLMDDAKARKYAKLLNIEVIGTLGLQSFHSIDGKHLIGRGIKEPLAYDYRPSGCSYNLDIH